MLTTEQLSFRKNIGPAIERFAAAVEAGAVADMAARYPDMPNATMFTKVTVHYGSTWARVDVGTSGRFVVELNTGDIFGIKAYGRPHRRYRYGNVVATSVWLAGPWAPRPVA